MSEKIEYVFSTISPWAFIGNAFFVDIARRNNVEIDYRPVNLLEVFNQTGGLPLGKRHPARQNYRWYELQRWRDVRNINLNLKPAHWPFKFNLLDLSIIAAIRLQKDPADFVQNAMLGIWCEDKDLSDPDMIVDTADRSGLPGREVVELAEKDECAEQYALNTNQAIENGCFGSPTYWLNGEMFFGQDRLEQLEQALTSGRAPYKIIE